MWEHRDEEHDAADEERERGEHCRPVDRVDRADRVLPLWFDRRRAASPLAFLTVAFAPTWNVNAPSTGCVSADVTRHVTT